MTVELVSHDLLQFVLISFIFKSWMGHGRIRGTSNP